MHIQFVRSGGFAGLRMSAEIDSEALSHDELQNLREALDTANFFSLPQQMMGDLGAADRFQYEITVDDGGRQHTVIASDAAMPKEMQPLVHELERIARTQRGK